MAGVGAQILGMAALCKTAIHSGLWAFRLWRGPITRKLVPPGPKSPLVMVTPGNSQYDGAPREAEEASGELVSRTYTPVSV